MSKKKSVALAVLYAKSVLRIFEKDCPGDKRPANAIAAAEWWLKRPSEINRQLAATAGSFAADAAYSANATNATRAAYAAAECARTAATFSKSLAVRHASFAVENAADAKPQKNGQVALAQQVRKVIKNPFGKICPQK